ncbi:MAG: hypothetical protein LUI13_08655 [Lachnospiraceae bacterium]|nr:hypothetical protein [Lachnospiraceae bacterium]
MAKMMKYFKSADPDDMSHSALSKRVRYLKREKGGYELMSKEAENLYNLGVEEGREKGIEQGIEQGIAQSEKNKAKETAKAVMRMLKDDIPVEKIALYQNLSIEDVLKIREKTMQEA